MALRPCRECGKEVSSDANACPHCGKRIQKKTSTGTGCLAIIIGFVVIAAVIGSIQHSGSGGTSSPATDNPKDLARSQVSLDFKWRKGGFDSVMEATFTIKNDSNFDLKDFEIKCEHFSKSGTSIDSNNRTIYDVVKAHSRKKFPNFNMGFIHSQAATTSCGIRDFGIAQ